MPCPLCLQATLMREELHAQHARSLQDKDALRKQVRELSEKVDELQLQLFQREGQLLAVEGKLRRRQLDALILVGLRRVSPATGVLEGGGGAATQEQVCPGGHRAPGRSRQGSLALPEPLLSPEGWLLAEPPWRVAAGLAQLRAGHDERAGRYILARPSREELPWWGAWPGTPPHAQEWLGSLTAC